MFNSVDARLVDFVGLIIRGFCRAYIFYYMKDNEFTHTKQAKFKKKRQIQTMCNCPLTSGPSCMCPSLFYLSLLKTPKTLH